VARSVSAATFELFESWLLTQQASHPLDAPIRGGTMRTSIGGALLVVWLLIGLVAAIQRDYFDSSSTNCAELGTVAVTVIAGPLNYMGVNPKVKCDINVPQPSN
jgi:hypothetical protein